MPPAPLFAPLAAVLGLIVGSFLNVVVHRLPRGGSLWRPRSSCPYCRGPVLARDNVPLLSFVLLGARCRHCRAPISWRYPALEALTGLLFAACAWRFGPTLEALAAAIFCSLLVALAAIDLEHFLLPDKLTLPGILVGLAFSLWLPRPGFLAAAAGAVVGAGLLILLINFWFWLRGEEGMGLGDVNMLALVGAFLGWTGMLVTLVASALVGALTGLALIAAGRMERRSRLPFGAFLAVGGILALFWGEGLVEAYRRLL